MAIGDPQTGGTVAPAPGALGPEITTSDDTYGKKEKTGKKRRRGGKVEYQWPNGSWHSRAFGKQHRDDGPSGSSGSGGSGNGHSGAGGGVHETALDHELNAAVRLRFGDQTQGLLQQQRGVGGWFDQYRAALAQARASTASLYNVNNGTPVGGATPQVTDPTDVDQQATANRAALSNAFSGLMQDQGAALASGYDMQGANSVLQEGGQRLAIGRDLQELRKDKGAFRTDWLRQRKQDDRQYNLEAGALNVDQANVQLKADQLSADAKAPNKYGYNADAWQSMTPEQRRLIMRNQAKWGKAGPKEEYIFGIPASDFHHMSRADQLKAKAQWDHAGDTGSGGSKGKDRNGNTADKRRSNNNQWDASFTHAKDYGKPDGQLKGYLLKQGVPADIAAIRAFKATHQFITPQMAAKLKKLSIKYTGKVKPLGGGTPRPGTAPVDPATGAAPY